MSPGPDDLLMQYEHHRIYVEGLDMSFRGEEKTPPSDQGGNSQEPGWGSHTFLHLHPLGWGVDFTHLENQVGVTCNSDLTAVLRLPS